MKKHTSDPETETDVFSVSDQVINSDMSLRPYEIKDFLEHQEYLKNLPSEYAEGWPDGMAYPLRMVISAAVKAGRGPAVAHHFQRAVSKAIEDFNLKDHLATILCEELGHVPDEEVTEPAYSRNTAEARAGFLTALPIGAGCRFRGMKKGRIGTCRS